MNFSATSERTLLRSDFSIQKNQSHAQSFLLYRKRSHSRRLFGCKRPHNAFGSLPTFCEESAYGANIFLRECLRHKYPYCAVLPLSERGLLHSDFSVQKNRIYQVRADAHSRPYDIKRCMHTPSVGADIICPK